jgi:hypothetical protein
VARRCALIASEVSTIVRPALRRLQPLLVLSAFCLCQCRKTPPAEKQAPLAYVDVNANGTRLAAALRDWPARWKDVPALADCTPLLEVETERESCRAAQRAVDELEAALERHATSAELLASISSAALKAQRAAQNLRRSGMTRLVELRRAEAAAASASASAPPKPSAAPPHGAKVPASASAHSLAPRQQQSPDLDAITSYARVAGLGLRHLGDYLELAPIELRRRAFENLSALSAEEPHWAGLHVLVREARLVEGDPELKRKLASLTERLGPG